MSQRVYTGVMPRRQPPAALRGLPWLFTAATIGLQIAWPLTSTDTAMGGDARDVLTVAIVGCFALATLSWIGLSRGRVQLVIYVAVTVSIGLGVEVLGTRTGFPFGTYAYADSLGPKVFGVPIIVPLAWSMMAYPALVAARAVTWQRRSTVTVAVGAVALASWDLFLDPQMTGDGHWSFAHPTPGLPGVDGIPLTNYLGWLLTSAVMMTVLHAVMDLPVRRPRVEGPPAVLYLWTWAGGIVANAFFLGRPSVALWGGIAMGVVAVPYARWMWSSRP